VIYLILNCYLSRLDLSGSRDVIGHVTIRFHVGHFLSVVLWNQPPLCNGFRDIQCECDAMVDMTLNDLYAKVKVIYFGTNRFRIYDFL